MGSDQLHTSASQIWACSVNAPYKRFVNYHLELPERSFVVKYKTMHAENIKINNIAKVLVYEPGNSGCQSETQEQKSDKADWYKGY